MFEVPSSSSSPEDLRFQKDCDAYSEAWEKFCNDRFQGLTLEQAEQTRQGSEMAVQFLLVVSDNGEEYFAKAVETNLSNARNEVAEKLESGDLAGAQKLATLTKALGQRQTEMYTHTTDNGNTMAIRKVSAPITPTL